MSCYRIGYDPHFDLLRVGGRGEGEGVSLRCEDMYVVFRAEIGGATERTVDISWKVSRGLNRSILYESGVSFFELYVFF